MYAEVTLLQKQVEEGNIKMEQRFDGMEKQFEELRNMLQASM